MQFSSSCAQQTSEASQSEDTFCDPARFNLNLNLPFNRCRTESDCSRSTQPASLGPPKTDLLQGIYDIKKDLLVQRSSFDSSEEWRDADPEQRIYKFLTQSGVFETNIKDYIKDCSSERGNSLFRTLSCKKDQNQFSDLTITPFQEIAPLKLNLRSLIDQVTPSELQKKARLFVVNETESSQSPGSSELTKKAKLAPAYFDNPEDSQSSPKTSLAIR